MALTIYSKEYLSSFPPEIQEIMIDYLFDYTKHCSQQVYIHDIEDLCVYNQLNFHLNEEKIKENIHKFNIFSKNFYYFDPDDFIVEYKNKNTISIKTNIEYDEEIKEKTITTNHKSNILNFLTEKEHNTFVFFEKKLWDSILTTTLKKHIITKNIQNIYYYSNNDSLLWAKYKDQLDNDDDLIPHITPPDIQLISNMPIKYQQKVTDINFSISYDYEPDPYDIYYFG